MSQEQKIEDRAKELYISERPESANENMMALIQRAAYTLGSYEQAAQSYSRKEVDTLLLAIQSLMLGKETTLKRRANNLINSFTSKHSE